MWYRNAINSNYTFYHDFKVQLPDVVVRWLSFIPITLFTALVIDSIIQQTPHGEGYTLNIPYIIALIPTVILSLITRSLTITIISGIVIMAALRFSFKNN